MVLERVSVLSVDGVTPPALVVESCGDWSECSTLMLMDNGRVDGLRYHGFWASKVSAFAAVGTMGQASRRGEKVRPKLSMRGHSFGERHHDWVLKTAVPGR